MEGIDFEQESLNYLTISQFSTNLQDINIGVYHVYVQYTLQCFWECNILNELYDTLNEGKI
jgi:hypothetical protein